MGFFARMRDRLRRVQIAPEVALANAASRVQEKLTKDATSKRGNVPSFGKFGKVPIAATVSGNSLNVTAAEWVMKKAQSLGQPREWAAIVKDELRKAVQ
jgi:hypothetical protein